MKSIPFIDDILYMATHFPALKREIVKINLVAHAS
jgi:hypothetical protein